MPLRLPRRDDRPSLHHRLPAGLVAATLTLLAPWPVAAASVLQNPIATPPSGTTETVFVISVDYVTDSSWAATSVSVEIVGLGGSPLPMSLVAGTDVDGTWQSNPTMLPEGTWELVLRATNDGPPPQQPSPIAGPTVIVTAPSPTPTATPIPSAAPSSQPTAPATPSPAPTRPPTPVPTPLPPGTTPTPLPTAPPSSSAPAPSGTTASASARATDEPSGAPSGSRPPSSGTSAPVASPTASASTGADGGGESGWGQAGWVVLGGVTSAAGAAVLLRQWLASRRTTPVM